MAELLLELGCEELPASFVRKAYEDLASAIASKLDEAGVTHGATECMGTPRRLIVYMNDVAEQQPDTEIVQRGPGLAAAFDVEGKPTKALEGFCRSQVVSIEELKKEGGYVWARKKIHGKPTAELLAEILPASIRGLAFEKAMRWGSLRMRFARPIRWILALFDSRLVPFDIDGVEAGLESRGHRFNSMDRFEARSFHQLVSQLRMRNVEPDPRLREESIRTGSRQVASGTPVLDDALVEENVFLTEWPVAIEGSFKEEYLELPAPVLVTAMAKHEKFFPIADNKGALTNKFVSIRNGGVDDVVRQGNGKVLNARFNDAKFFYQEDRKSTLADFLEKTRGIIFQDKLGTVRERATRLGELCAEAAKATGAPLEEIEYAEMAGLYAKADLSAGLVTELPGLQGLIGGEYAKRDRFAEPVCWAIATQYDPSKNPRFDSVRARTAGRLLMADQLDKLAGYLGIGQVPKGSSDPYGLRRAATVLIDGALRWSDPFPGYEELYQLAQELYRSQGYDLAPSLQALSEIFRSRYNSIFADTRYDLIDAAISGGYTGSSSELKPQMVRFKISVLDKLAGDVAFVQTATRPHNILSAAVQKGIPFAFDDPLSQLGRLDSPEGDHLCKIARSLSLHEGVPANDLIPVLKGLEEPINKFFDSTLVMDEDGQIRYARLSLLHGVNLLLNQAGDFSKIVIAG